MRSRTFGQCEATTKKGKRCRYPVYEETILVNDKNKLCYLHWEKETNGLQPYAQQKLKELRAKRKHQ